MDEYITLADGTQVSPCHILSMTDTDIIVYVKGAPGMVQMCDWFGHAEKTQTITANRYGEVQTFAGYTELYSLRIETSNLATACLRKVIE